MNEKNTGKRCGAKTRAGGTCQTRSMPNGRCRLHGGTSLKGAASPSFKHGKYSTWLPDYHALSVRAAIDDDQIEDVREHLALIDQLAGAKLRMLPDGGGRTSWAAVVTAFAAFQTAQANGRVTSMKLALDQLEAVIAAGSSEEKLQDDVVKLIGERIRLTDHELKRKIGLFYMIPGAEAIGMMQALIDSVKRHVPDRRTVDAIQAEYGSIVGRLSESPVATRPRRSAR